MILIRFLWWAFVFLIAATLAQNWIPGVVAIIASLDRAGFTFGATLGFVVGMAVIVVGYRMIHNAIVESDRQNDLAGVNKKHDARRI